MKMKECCGFDLRTGGLIIAYSCNIFAYLGPRSLNTQIPQLTTEYLIFIMFVFLVAGSCLYGIHRNRSSLMLPFLTVLRISIVLGALLFVLIPLDYWSSTYILRKLFIEKATQQDRDIIDQELGIFYIFHWIESAAGTGLAMYFTKIMHPLYKSIKATQDRLTTYHH